MGTRARMAVGAAAVTAGLAAGTVARRRGMQAYCDLLYRSVVQQMLTQSSLLIAAAQSDVPADKALALLMSRADRYVFHPHNWWACALTFRVRPEILNVLFVDLDGHGRMAQLLVRQVAQHHDVEDPRVISQSQPPRWFGVTLLSDDDPWVVKLATKLSTLT
jgi:hypothetical protein